MYDRDKLRDDFKNDTGESWEISGTDGVHCVVITVPNKKYVEWLEDKVSELKTLRFINHLLY